MQKKQIEPVNFGDIEKKLISYCKNVLDDKIIACQKYKWACLRFLNDLQKSKTGNFDWVFLPEKALRYLHFTTCFIHANGDLAGKRKEPVDYEIFVYANLYGWWSKDGKLRRFRRSYEQLARKNAKSQDKGIQALYEIGFLGEQKAEAYIAASKRDQTRHVWGQAKWLYENALYPEIREMYSCKFDDEFMTKVIKHIDSSSIFSRLSRDDKKLGDGTNPSFMVIDEYHLHETTEYYDLATSGMKTRKNPLLSIITTAGFNLVSPCYSVEYDYVSKILNPTIDIDNDRYFIAICEVDKNETSQNIVTKDGRTIKPSQLIDKIDSEEAIIKANPVIGYSENSRNNIMLEIKEAIDKPEKMRDVLTKTLNVWVSMRESGYMDMIKWDKCGYKYKTENHHQEFFDLLKAETDLICNIGCDIGSKHDLTSVSFEFTNDKNHYYVYNISFLPEEALHSHIEKDRVPYDLWAKNEWLIITSGSVTDLDTLEEYIYKTLYNNKWKCKGIGLDPWGTLQLSIRLKNSGLNPIEVPQSMASISEPTKNLREVVYKGNLTHCNSPLLNWAMNNAVEYSDKNENIMLTKKKSANRIDPVASLINSHKLTYIDTMQQSIYETRGVRTIEI